MLTTFARLFLARKITPFEFRPAPDFLPGYDVPSFGIYVHIPFCESLCPFCPYFKTEYDENLAARYVEALHREIDLVWERLGGRNVTTLYFGGGSPALVAERLPGITSHIRERFPVSGDTGVELHPRDVCERTLSLLRDAGATMVSLGAQSFRQASLDALGRKGPPPLDALRLIAKAGFRSVDVDLIFGIPGQSEADLTADFTVAAENGATQVSTYPFIDFSYADNRRKPAGHGEKKRLLDALIRCAGRLGFERTSVWTFGKAGSPRYSSITRDSFLGFGPSATSLGRGDFKMNTFSVQAYIESIGRETLPTALRMRFTPRARAAYWLFWNSYNGAISEAAYRNLFGRELRADFGFHLRFARALGLLSREDPGVWRLSPKGSLWFHRIEQVYTLRYIDRTWRASLETPWPERIQLY